MLNQLIVKNFAIAEHLSIHFDAGMTVLSGETGAGKSIILDALGLTLGDRADSDMVRHGKDKAEISSEFDIGKLPSAQSWLRERDLEDGEQCILRRVITAEGRSRAYINGQPCSLNDLKEIGEQLIDIHSQHAHQSLLRREQHRGILDEFAQLHEINQHVAQAFDAWAAKQARLKLLEDNQEAANERLQLLQFQVEELDRLALEEDEAPALESEQAELANAEALLSGANKALQLCDDSDESASALLNMARHELEQLPTENKQLSDARALLEEALIQVSEAASSLNHFLDGFELNPERLGFVEERLSAIYQLARKHRCAPDELYALHQTLSQQLAQLTGGDEDLDSLRTQVSTLRETYLEAANQQRELRQIAGRDMEQRVADKLAELNMANVRFCIVLSALDDDKVSRHGLDQIEFLVSTNPGHPPKALNKVASGGELSRISLAIQVVIAQHSTIPTLVFDEVDSGIGGATAQIVGRLLKAIGQIGQVICVTHLPQVAAQGQQHLFISKAIIDGQVCSSIEQLAPDERTREIARMLGGIEITIQTLAHAQEMLTLT